MTLRRACGSRHSDVPVSILDEAGERLFLVTLPDKEPTHTWAGDWKDSLGGFGLRWLPWEQFVTLPQQPGHEQLWDKLKELCPLGADHYEGDYYDPPTEAGKIVACAARGGKELVARYLSECDGHGGFFKITMSSPTSWSGIYRDDGHAAAPRSGTFEKHFSGNGG